MQKGIRSADYGKKIVLRKGQARQPIIPKFAKNFKGKREMLKAVKLSSMALTMPVLTFEGQENSIPKTLMDRLPQMRFIQLMKDENNFLTKALDTEVMIFIMSASLAGPLDHTMAQIQKYLVRKYQIEVLKKEPTEEYAEPIELTQYQKEEYEKLKSWIRRKQIKEFEARERRRNGK